MNIIVCGTRDDLTDAQKRHINDVLDGYTGKHVLIEGAARGVDTYAFKYAQGHGWGTRRFPADWKRLGKMAGPIRNQQMLDENEVDLVIAFPSEASKGTWDMVERAVWNRVPVRVYPL